jgi:hypothetical protein
MNKRITEVNRLYQWRREQILDLFQSVTKRAATSDLKMGARNLEEVDVIFQGYITRYQNLFARLDELDKEYHEILSSLVVKTWWYSWFGWLPLLKVTTQTKNYIEAFINKWEKYEPGW